MPSFTQVRHKPPVELARPRELVVACPPMRSNVNLSHLVRTAGCCGVQKTIVCGTAKIDPKIARDGAEQVELEFHRTLPPVLRQLKSQGFALVGLEQAMNSVSLFEFAFPRRTVLVVGHERDGLSPEVLALLDAVVEIPVYGLPHSYNVATAAAMALYEYCRQYPNG
jgi:tRNA G18 (ribose-2'-O)-methylase SpoU